jgi:hypothetical protein
MFRRVALFVALMAVVAGLVIGFAPKTVRYYDWEFSSKLPPVGGTSRLDEPDYFAACGSGFVRTSPSRRSDQGACADRANLDSRATAGAGLIVVGVLLAGGLAIFRPTTKREPAND